MIIGRLLLVLAFARFFIVIAAPPELLPPTNPIIKSIYTADPSAHVWPTNPDKLYLYPSRDQDPPRGCDLMDQYHVFSTVDLVHWTDEGEILRADDLEWGRPDGGFMWAPDAAYRNNNYFFYYPHPAEEPWGKTWEIGVAISKFPDRDFIDLGPILYATTRPDYTDDPNSRRDGMIDPCVFIDSDDTPFLFIGNGASFYGEMNPDLISMKYSDKETLKRIPNEQVPNYHEGPFVFKRNDIYYLTYPGSGTTIDGKRSDRMHYSTSTSVHGPWTPRGFFHNPVNTGDTSHGSIVQFKGRWFFFYHNSEVFNADPGNTQGNLRSVCVDEMFFNEDGTIQMVIQTTTGPKPIENAPPEPIRNIKVYPVSQAQLAGNAKFATSAGWDAVEPVLTGLAEDGDSATFNNVDGGTKGGRASLKVRYATADRHFFKLIVNDFDWGYINLLPTGGDGVFVREADFTVTNMKPGAGNTIVLKGRNNGSFGLAQISVAPFEDQ